MAVSELVLKRCDESMELFREAFPASASEVRIRSPRRKSGDREFLLNQAGKNTAGIHVKHDSYKMYMSDNLVNESEKEYNRLQGGQFLEFINIEDCIAEIKCTMEKTKYIV